MPTFLGIDLSATRVAVACIGEGPAWSDCYQAAPCKKEQHEERILRACGIAGVLDEWLKRLPPDAVVAIEAPSATGRGGDVVVGEVFGLCQRVLVSHCAGRWFRVHPLQLRKFVTGTARPQEGEERIAVYKRWGFEASTQDEVDSFGLAQMGRCAVEPEGYTVAQGEVVAACFGNARGAKNLQFVLAPRCPPAADPKPRARAVKSRRREAQAEPELAL